MAWKVPAHVKRETGQGGEQGTEIDARKLWWKSMGHFKKYLMLVGKVLMNLEVKLGWLEAANKKLNNAFEQSKDTEGAN